MLVYIASSDTNIGDALSTKQSLEAMRHTGFDVTVVHPTHTVSSLVQTVNIARRATYICIRIDKSGITDAYTFIKLFFWNKICIWEIRGFQEEKYFYKGLRTGIKATAARIQRCITSIFVSGFISPSKTLTEYARFIHTIPALLLPARPNIYPSRNTRTAPVKFWGSSGILTHRHNIVFVLGNPRDELFASDVLEKLMEWTYSKDPSVRFVIIGDHPLHPMTWSKNTIRIDKLPPDLLKSLLQNCLCTLTLYHRPRWCPLSLPSYYDDLLQFKLNVVSPAVYNGIQSPSDNYVCVNIEQYEHIGETLLSIMRRRRNNTLLRQIPSSNTDTSNTKSLSAAYKKFLMNL